MENASKALIIAGAILISIVLVSVGVLVVNSLNPDEGIDEMERQQIATFNSKIEGNTGNNKQGTVARQLISTIISNNSTSDYQITVNFGGKDLSSSSDLSTARNSISTTKRYNITASYEGEGGRINSVTITE